MRDFITSPLPKDPDDWECVEDFCGKMIDGEPINVGAWWSPSRKQTVFLGQWSDAPPMTSHSLPSEQVVWEWAKHRTIWGKRLLADQRRKDALEKRRNERKDRARENGVGWADVKLTLPDNTEKIFNQAVFDCETAMDLLKRVAYNLSLFPKGTKISKFRFKTVPYEKFLEWQKEIHA